MNRKIIVWIFAAILLISSASALNDCGNTPCESYFVWGFPNVSAGSGVNVATKHFDAGTVSISTGTPLVIDGTDGNDYIYQVADSIWTIAFKNDTNVNKMFILNITLSGSRPYIQLTDGGTTKADVYYDAGTGNYESPVGGTEFAAVSAGQHVRMVIQINDTADIIGTNIYDMDGTLIGTYEVAFSSGGQIDGLKIQEAGSAGNFNTSNIEVWECPDTTTSCLSQRPTGSGGTPAPDQFEIVAVDQFGNSVTNFNASIDGIDYNTINGTLKTNLYDNTSSLYDIYLFADSYENKTYYNYNVSADLNAVINVFQPLIINATDLTNSSVILNFSILFNGTTYSTINGSLKVNSIISNDYTDEIISFNITSENYLTREIINFNSSITNQSIYLYGLRTYATDYKGAAIVSYSVSVDSDIYTIGSGGRRLPISAGYYSFTFLSSTHENKVINTTIYIDYTNASATTGSLNFSGLYDHNSINITFWYDLNPRVLANNINITVEFISSTFSYNYTIGTGTLYATLLSPEEYIIRYYDNSTGIKQSYYLNLNNGTHSELDLYIYNYSFEVSVTIYDETTLDTIEGAIIYLQKYYHSTNDYRTVSMYSSDTAGKGYFKVDQNELYKFAVEYPLGNRRLTTSPVYIESNSVNLYVRLTEQIGTEFFNEQSIKGTITYLDSRAFSVNWVDLSNVGTEYCLYIKQYDYYSRTSLNSSCSTSSSGSIILGLPAANTTYYAIFTAKIDGVEKTITTGWQDIVSDNLTSGGFGVFLSIILIIMLGLLSSVHFLALFFVAFGLIISKILGLLALEWGYIIAVAIGSTILAVVINLRK